MSVTVIDFQNSTFEHELYNVGLIEALHDVFGSVTVHSKASLARYYSSNFPEVQKKVAWRTLNLRGLGDFSILGSIRLAVSLIKLVDGETTHLLFTTTTPSSLLAIRMAGRHLRKKSPAIKICSIFHGMLANLEPELRFRPDPWFKLSKFNVPVVYPSRALLSLSRTLRVLLSSNLRECVYFGFLTTKAKSLFENRFNVASCKVLFTPICIPSSVKTIETNRYETASAATQLRVGILGWSSSTYVAQLVSSNPNTQFHFFGSKPAVALPNVVAYGASLDRAAIAANSSVADVFMLPRKNPPSNWSLSGVPSEMLIFSKKLIVPNDMKITHYGLPEDLTIPEGCLLDSGTQQFRSDIDRGQLFVDLELIESTRNSLSEMLRENLRSLIHGDIGTSPQNA